MLHPDESTLIGQWIADRRFVVADETCRRIDALVASYLMELATSADGGSALYQDPADGRLWERTYPQSDLHGGGPPVPTVHFTGAGWRRIQPAGIHRGFDLRNVRFWPKADIGLGDRFRP